MIIYACSIWLEKTTPWNDIFSTITYWLHIKTKNSIFSDTFMSQSIRNFSDGSILEIFKTDHEFPVIYSFRYTEKDNQISGRRWTTEIGIRQESPDADIQCSILVQTSEISVSVLQPKQTTRPWLIVELLKRCKPSRRTIGTTIKTIDDLFDVEALAYEIDSYDRKYPIILISPNSKGEYLVNIEQLLAQTIGLAEIIQIPVEGDTYKIANILGKSHSAYNGAINILFPLIKKGETSFVPTKLLLAEFFENIKDQGNKVETEILTLISHRMNLPNFWQHITPEMVKDAQRKRELAKLRQNNKDAGNLQQYIELLEEDNQQKQTDIERLQSEMDSLQNDNNYYFDEYDKAAEEVKAQQYKINGLITQLDSLKNTRQNRGELEDCSEELRGIFEEYIKGYISPTRSLELISRLFPDRVIILDSALKSAKESEVFVQKKIIFELLLKLATDYWEALIAGKGDTEARQIFGNDYAPKESETVERNKSARKRRTFNFCGEEIEMMKHLKYGVKNSPEETIRIHFEWLSEKRRIIIGYCGPHLDFD